ncbi:MAG TPA: DegT/DnrJ/EryC1/StrS family aminotransferase [Polyangiaceae bacterium]|nr:DegT/DnrJ/EryC1/StrS family aminotransferase [Polyangiaceae bacterium]
MIPLTDLEPQHRALRQQLLDAVARVFDERAFVLGRHVREFERSVASLLGAEAAIGVSSGTDALIVSLLAAGVGPGDEVITTPLSFVATAEAIVRVGATPRFVDVDEATLCLDPEAARAAITPRTRALLPVHLFGHPADVVALAELASTAGLELIEDCAQAFGARASGESGGRYVGVWGSYGAFSFFPAKVLGGAGDGGLVLTTAERAERVERLRQHGTRDKETFVEVGGNFRLDALQAAVLSVKLPHVMDWVEGRRRVAARYLAAFSERATPGVELPVWHDGHAFNHFVIRSDARDALKRALSEAEIASAAYYATPLHRQPCFASFEHGELPRTERASRRLLALPIYPELPGEAVERIVEVVDAAARKATNER